MTALADIWAEITTPSAQSEGVYYRALIAMAHGLLGGALVAILPALLVVVAYVVCKELWWDWWYSRGSLRDSLHDSGAVCFGVGLAVHFGVGVSIAFAVLLAYGVFAAIIYRSVD